VRSEMRSEITHHFRNTLSRFGFENQRIFEAMVEYFFSFAKNITMEKYQLKGWYFY
jgi:hypothetical protein